MEDMGRRKALICKRRRQRRVFHTTIIALHLVVFLCFFIFSGIKKNQHHGESGVFDSVFSTVAETKGMKETDGTGETDGIEEADGAGKTDDAGEADSTEETGGDAWKLLLVNPWNEIPEDHSVELTWLKNNQAVDSRCYEDLQQMMDDCRADGLEPLICSSYRTMEKQMKLYNDMVERLKNQGYGNFEAAVEAGKVVAVPGTSEHQTGLALDIVDKSYQKLDREQEETAVQKWLLQHSWEYGFILRYPEGKSNVTGIKYEPWHYRYVGKEAAEEIFRQELTLEEYIASHSDSGKGII